MPRESTERLLEVSQEGAVTASIAAAFTLGREGCGFLVAAVFPPGEWESERGDFFRVVESFRSRVLGPRDVPHAGEA